jgi:CheY-like chemotaxis protein
VAPTSAEAIQALQSERFDLVLLDHDLGLDDQGDGCDVAQALVDTPNKAAIIFVQGPVEEAGCSRSR